MIRLATERPFKRHDIPIGEVFEYNGNYYKMTKVPYNPTCRACSFCDDFRACVQLSCLDSHRKDNNNCMVVNSSITKIDRIK